MLFRDELCHQLVQHAQLARVFDETLAFLYLIEETRMLAYLAWNHDVERDRVTLPQHIPPSQEVPVKSQLQPAEWNEQCKFSLLGKAEFQFFLDASFEEWVNDLMEVFGDLTLILHFFLFRTFEVFDAFFDPIE